MNNALGAYGKYECMMKKRESLLKKLSRLCAYAHFDVVVCKICTYSDPDQLQWIFQIYLGIYIIYLFLRFYTLFE